MSHEITLRTGRRNDNEIAHFSAGWQVTFLAFDFESNRVESVSQLRRVLDTGRCGIFHFGRRLTAQEFWQAVESHNANPRNSGSTVASFPRTESWQARRWLDWQGNNFMG